MAEITAPALVLVSYAVSMWLVMRDRVRWWIVGTLIMWLAFGIATWANRPFLRDNTLGLVLWCVAIAECAVWTMAVFRCYLPHPERSESETKPDAEADTYASTTRVYRYTGRRDETHI